MRQRIEDLGRLSVLLRNLLKHNLFDDNNFPHRKKEYWEWFHGLTDDRKEDVLHQWIYGIESIEDEIYRLLEIAEGRDDLNDKEME